MNMKGYYIVFEQELNATGRVNRVWGMFDSYDAASNWLKTFTGRNDKSFYYGIRVIQNSGV